MIEKLSKIKDKMIVNGNEIECFRNPSEEEVIEKINEIIDKLNSIS